MLTIAGSRNSHASTRARPTHAPLMRPLTLLAGLLCLACLGALALVPVQPPPITTHTHAIQTTPWSRQQLSDLQARAVSCGANATIEEQASPTSLVSSTSMACPPSRASLLRRPGGDEIVVVTTMDAAYAPRLAPFVASVHAHNRRRRIRVVVLTTYVLGDDRQADMCAPARDLPSITLEFHAVRPDVLHQVFNYKTRPGAKNVLAHVPIATMMRLLAPAILPYDKVVYLDLDVLVRADLAALHQGDACTPRQVVTSSHALESSGVCAKPSIVDNLRYGQWMLPAWMCAVGIDPRTKLPQFNAGVMVVDMAHLRRRGFVPYALALSAAFSLNDQTILNLYANGTFDELAPHLNVFYGQDSHRFPQDNAILHPAGSRKPWMRPGHDWSDLWVGAAQLGHLFVWTSALDGLSPEEVGAVDNAATHAAGRPVTAYCGNAKCMRQLQRLPGVQAVRFRVHDFTSSSPTSPLAPWFQDHAILKVLHGRHYEKLLQAAARLAVLYHYGGVLHGGGVALKAGLPSHALQAGRPWCWDGATARLGVDADGGPPPSRHGRLGVDAASRSINAIFAPRRHPSVLRLMDDFLAARPSYHRGDAWPIDWSRDWLGVCPSHVGAHPPFAADRFFTRLAKGPGNSTRPTFGALWYDERARYLASVGNHAVNLGDEIQSLAAVQWLPFVEHRVERDRMAGPTRRGGNTSEMRHDRHVFNTSSVTFVMNAWYGTPGMTWPPAETNLDPVPVAVHVESKLYGTFADPASLAYLRARQPIGARDAATLKFLQAHNVSAYFSACLTLTMSLPRAESHADAHNDAPDCGVLFVDVDAVLLKDFVPKNITACATHFSAKWRDVHGSKDTLDGLLRFQKAFELLKALSRARLVVTSRLHTALPAAAMGVPVVLVLADSMPGGGGASDGMQRFAGLADVVHWVRLGSANASAPSAGGKVTSSSPGMVKFDWQAPPANPGELDMKRLRGQLLARMSRSHPHLRDSIETFSTPADEVERWTR